MIVNPLEQFKILVLQKISFLGLDLSLTNSSLIIIFVAIIFFFYFHINYSFNSYLPTKFHFFAENIYMFALQIVRQQTNTLISLRYFPLILFIFSFILILNLIGLVPYGFTVTGHIIFTFQIAFSLFLGITLINIFNNGLMFLKLFIPNGVPVLLLPFLILIEIASYIIRPFSLAVRLFANMLAGHTLLNIISSFIFNVFKNYSALVIFPLFFIAFIIILEFCIAFVQAYIFSILLCIYINDVYNVNH